jgi:hypothetical protein
VTRSAVALVALVAAAPACSKKPFEGEITMHTTAAVGPAHDLVLKAKADKLRFDMKGTTGEETHGLYDPEANKVTVFLDSQKAYMDMDFSSGAAAKPNIDPKSASAKKTGKSETIAGMSCDDYSVEDGTGKRTEVCLASGLVYFDIGSLRPGGSVPSLAALEFKAKKLFPLKSVEYDATGKETTRMEVTKIERKTLDGALFVVPADYKKVEMPRLPGK